MDVQSRITSLYDDGQRREAVELAREALKNESVEGVDIEQDSVTVETTNFVGEHRVVAHENEEVVVAEEGDYWLKDDPDVSFSTRDVYDNIFAAIDEAESENDPSADEPGAAGDPVV